MESKTGGDVSWSQGTAVEDSRGYWILGKTKSRNSDSSQRGSSSGCTLDKPVIRFNKRKTPCADAESLQALLSDSTAAVSSFRKCMHYSTKPFH